MNINELFDAAKKKHGIETDTELALLLDTPKQRISRIRKGNEHPSVYTSAKLAKALGMEPSQVIAQVEADSEKDENKKAFWEDLARAAIFLAVVSSFFVSPSPAEASSGKASLGSSVYYVKWCHKMTASKIKRQLQRLAALFMQTLESFFAPRVCKM